MLQQQQQPAAPAAAPQQAPQQQQPPRRPFVVPPGFIFDSDMGRSIDTVLAAALLHGLGTKGRIIAAGVSNCSLEAAGFCEVLARFYSGEPPGSMARQAAPVAVDEQGCKPSSEEAAHLRQALSRKTADDKPAFRHSIDSLIDTSDPRVLYRNALLSQKQRECTVVLAGPASNLVGLLQFSGAADIVKDRVGVLVAALGCYGGDGTDPRVAADIQAARYLFDKWPGPIVAVGMETGEAIPFPGSSLESSFSWASVHPVVEAYKAYRPTPYDAPAQALAAALHASAGKDSLFRMSEPGTIRVRDNGQTEFSPASNGAHKYLIADPAQRQRIQEAYVAGVSAKPAPPRRPFF